MAKQIWRVAWVDQTGRLSVSITNWPEKPDTLPIRDTGDRWTGVIELSSKPVVIPAEAVKAMRKEA